MELNLSDRAAAEVAKVLAYEGKRNRVAAENDPANAPGLEDRARALTTAAMQIDLAEARKWDRRGVRDIEAGE